MPIVLEAKKRGIESKFYTFHIDKEYEKIMSINDPSCDAHPYRHYDYIKNLAKEYDFEFNICKTDNEIEGLTFFCEKRGLSNVNKKIPKAVITFLRDFAQSKWYENYIDKVDHVIFPSKFFAEHYGKISLKNLYLGSPKYDLEFDKEKIREKYNIRAKKNALIMFLETPGLDASLRKIYIYLKEMGFNLIVKGRGKQYPGKQCADDDFFRGDQYFEDDCWFPHTSMDLINISDIVINFDSTVTKECVMDDTPFINFDVKDDFFPFKFLLKYKYCENFKVYMDRNKFKDGVSRLTENDYSDEFKKCRDNHLFEKGNISGKILDALEKYI